MNNVEVDICLMGPGHISLQTLQTASPKAWKRRGPKPTPEAGVGNGSEDAVYLFQVMLPLFRLVSVCVLKIA